ncbi:expressed unknown protein [Seminavis robusta]|uniref:Uncharacterized protein n=1 Tax=Seminavis robusta TaxID=568900 RepID=A0A9N8DPG3_9STRA|nr:expressed unknown protein [Seminavis robusta]|eukprot:Sro277_g106180.1 n/a (157) ;mRNA; r:13269-13739
MMLADFQPVFLTPLSQTEPMERLVPRAPRPGKRRSDRVTSLLMNNLELFQSPMLSGDASSSSPNKRPCLKLQPSSSSVSSSPLFNDALERMRQKGMPPRSVIAPAKKRRSAPTLPEASARRGSNGSAEGPVVKHEMDRTPIRSPPVRSNSGLARCA